MTPDKLIKYRKGNFELKSKHIYAKQKLENIRDNILLSSNLVGGAPASAPIPINYDDAAKEINEIIDKDSDKLIQSFEPIEKKFNYYFKDYMYDDHVKSLIKADKELTNTFSDFYKKKNFLVNNKFKDNLIKIQKSLFKLQVKIIFSSLKKIDGIDINPILDVINTKIEMMNNYIEKQDSMINDEVQSATKDKQKQYENNENNEYNDVDETNFNMTGQAKINVSQQLADNREAAKKIAYNKKVELKAKEEADKETARIAAISQAQKVANAKVADAKVATKNATINFVDSFINKGKTNITEKAKKEEEEEKAKKKEAAIKVQSRVRKIQAKEKTQRLAKEKERLSKEETERLAKEADEKERLAKEADEKERLAKEEKEEQALKAKEEQAQKERKVKEETERLAKEKERLSKEETERLAKEEKERLEKERLAKEKQEREPKIYTDKQTRQQINQQSTIIDNSVENILKRDYNKDIGTIAQSEEYRDILINDNEELKKFLTSINYTFDDNSALGDLPDILVENKEIKRGGNNLSSKQKKNYAKTLSKTIKNIELDEKTKNEFKEYGYTENTKDLKIEDLDNIINNIKQNSTEENVTKARIMINKILQKNSNRLLDKKTEKKFEEYGYTGVKKDLKIKDLEYILSNITRNIDMHL